MNRLSCFVAALILISAHASLAEDPATFRPWSSPDKSIRCEVPAGWSDQGEGKNDLFFLGPSSGLGTAPALSVSFNADDGGYPSAEFFIRSKLKYGDATKLKTVLVSGKKAKRFQRQMMHAIDGKPEDFDPKAAPEQREDFVLVPAKHGFWILSYTANARYFDRDLPSFEHLLKTVKLNK